MTDQEIINRLWDFGHFNNPAFPNTLNVQHADLSKLTLTSPIVKEAVASFQGFMGVELDNFSFAHYNRAGIADGEVGVATRDLLNVERCGHPDYGYLDDNGNIIRGALPAMGNGSWKGCHSVGNFHCVSVHVDESNLPSFLAPHWDTVKANVSASYAELGLRIIWDNKSLPANIKVSFVTRRTGWIGLAIVGRSQSCGSSIWAQFQASYRGGQSAEAIIQQWTTLVKHELGHNCGLGHSRGGVMNPTIINGLKISWAGDPSYSTLRQWFGGVAVDTPPTTPPPGVPPKPRFKVSAGGVIEFVVPEGVTPGTYPFILVPRPEF